MRLNVLLTAVASVLVTTLLSAQDPRPIFTKSIAVVVGIDAYTDPTWERLTYAVKDARSFAAFLRSQGFQVYDLYDSQASKEAIISMFEDRVIPQLTANDRVLFFFAGHGATRTLVNTDSGFLVPWGATSAFSSFIPVATLHYLSNAMQAARHQLFILDSCFGGLAATRGSIPTINPGTPDYVYEITRRKARQLLTAGGANQRVRDGGPDGHSFFAGALLKALSEGMADKNGDGYITFSELSGYIQPAASAYNQTPGVDSFAGHEQGDFLFVNTVRAAPAATSLSPAETGGPTRSSKVDVYERLGLGKQRIRASDFAGARGPLREAAELGNAEAMVILGKLDWDGSGAPRDQRQAIAWMTAAAERGDLTAMRNLVNMYKTPGPFLSQTESQRWQGQADQAARVETNMTVIDPTGKAGDRNQPLSPAATSIPPPSAPTNLRIQ